MDNTKIFIDIDDEITFVAQRINDAPTKNIILVVPEKASIIGSLASLKLLKYVTEKSGKNIILVTMDDMGKIIASKAGFLVRNRVGEVENTIWQAFEKPVSKGINPLEETEPETQESLQEEQQEPVVQEQLPKPDMIQPLPEEAGKEPELAPEPIGIEEEKPPAEQVEQKAPAEELMLPGEDELVVVPEKSVESDKEEMKEEPMVKNKYVESVKIIKLDSFELVVGGDIAAIRRSREIERKVISQKKQTMNSFDDGIIGKDMEADIAKKKVTT